MSKENTLKSGGSENIIVDISAYSPLYLPISLTILVTLKTLSTLTI